jgi:protein associated with RNAse G/E
MICPHCGKHIDDTQQQVYSETGKKPMQKIKYHDFTLNVGRVTEKAFLFNDGVDEFWIPKSQMQFNGDMNTIQVGQTVNVQISDWISKQKGLVDESGAPATPKPYTPISTNDDIPF